jgi:GT2 family glycosyltransferase
MVTNQASKTPIALFTYNRPHHTRQALESLSRCKRFEECKLFIYCDGPKHPDQINNVIASQAVVQSFAEKLDADIIIQEKNIGLAHSVVSGVTDLCNRFGRVIVVEDDFVLSPDFVDYMLLALDKYEHEQTVYQVSGFLHNITHEKTFDAFFLPLTTTWGWGTWQRAWKLFDFNPPDCVEKIKDNDIRRKFNLDDMYPYSDMLENRLAGKNDSWGILWWWAVFNAQGLVLYPRKSLVWVGGFDNSGTHCGASDLNQSGSIFFGRKRLSEPIVLPSEIVSDITTFHTIKRWLKYQSGIAQRPTILSKIYERTKNLFLKQNNK